MNGRIYDPLLGRFLSADVVIPKPDQLQSYNRYSYVRNNPLRYTDPSGFTEEEKRRVRYGGGNSFNPRNENRLDWNDVNTGRDDTIPELWDPSNGKGKPVNPITERKRNAPKNALTSNPNSEDNSEASKDLAEAAEEEVEDKKARSNQSDEGRWFIERGPNYDYSLKYERADGSRRWYEFNYTKAGVGLWNIKKSAQKVVSAAEKGVVALVTSETVVGGVVAGAGALWDLKGAQAAFGRATTQLGEAFHEPASFNTRNLYGILPYGDKIDDPNEMHPIDFLRGVGRNLSGNPKEFAKDAFDEFVKDPLYHIGEWASF